jgi:DNA topoisomerase-6 subunit B
MGGTALTREIKQLRLSEELPTIEVEDQIEQKTKVVNDNSRKSRPVTSAEAGSVAQQRIRSRPPIAEELAKKQKEISVAEFFERNKHILGYDSPTRALITAVKEAIDNALDACEEAGILPDILLELNPVENAKDEYQVVVEDNGPGIVKKQIAQIFGKLLYGSRFNAIRQSRGQQGIGISAAVMYSQVTTGKPTTIISKIDDDHPAYNIQIILDTKKNQPEIVAEDIVLWDKPRGTRIELTMKGKYVRERKQSIYEYIRGSAIVNPHAKIILREPNGIESVFDRVTDILPKPTEEIKPHPEGIELGTLLNMSKNTDSYKMMSFLVNEFSRISYHTARELCDTAGIPQNQKPKDLSLAQAKALLSAIEKVKIMAPPTDCLSPIGETLIKKSLKHVLSGQKPEFYSPPVTRDPIVIAGNPIQTEVGMVFGGELPKDQSVEILRFANRVPLLYQQGACVTTHAIENIDWRKYGLEQRGGKGIPVGPAIILVHVASTNVPFTSESKEAIADFVELRKEIENALKFCGRKLKTHLNKQIQRNQIKEKFEIVQKILPLLAERTAEVVNKPVPILEPVIAKIMDIVWIEDTLTFEDKRFKAEIIINNYTTSAKKFKILVDMPFNFNLTNVNPKPDKIENGWLVWDIKHLSPLEKKVLSFELSDLDKDAYDENDVYVDGINPIHVVGAEPWHGVE